MNIKISILIPTYNRGNYLVEAIESVFYQLNDGDEILIIDDGSTDKTARIIEKYNGNENFRYIKKKHTNAPDTRNFAIKNAKNSWILWLDSDDILRKNTVDLYRDILKKNKRIDVLYGNKLVIGNVLNNNRRKWVFKDFYNKNEDLLAGLITNNLLPNTGVIVKKSIYEKFGAYNTDFIRVHDYEFWARVALDVKFKNCNKFVVKWRWHDGNMSTPSVYKDLKYESMVLDLILEKYELKQIFYNYNWDNENRSFAKAYYNISKAYKKWGQSVKSLKYLEKSIKYFPTNSSYLLLLNLYHFRLAESEKKKILESLLNLALTNTLKIKGRKINEKYVIASILKCRGKHNLSMMRFSEIEKKIENIEKFKELLSGVYFHKGDIFFKMNDLINAEKYFTKTISLNPEHKKAKEMLINIDIKNNEI